MAKEISVNILSLIAADPNLAPALRKVLSGSASYTPMSEERRRELRDEGDADDRRDRIYAEQCGGDDA